MSALLHSFGIDWKLLLAQAVNFFILLYVLKRFAYAPILKMLRERQERIKHGLAAAAEAERKLKDAEKKGAEIRHAAEHDALAVVGRAEDAALKKESDIIEDAHKKAETVLARAEEAAKKREKQHAAEMAGEAEELVRMATSKVLGRMEPSERDAVLIREALSELRAVQGDL